MQAQAYLNDGYEHVIELDLEKFFDKVNHDKLMGLLSKQITDKGTLKLIRSYLTSGIMEGGVASPGTEGTPQGSALSPLLSNIVLHELDKELETRGHRYVRYADDCSIYVRSEKSAQRVMETITEYIESKLKLKVNGTKSKVSRRNESTLLGFSFYRSKVGWEIRIAPKSLVRIKQKMKERTMRRRPFPRKGKDKENGSGNKRLGKLLFDSESQKQDEGIRRTGTNKATNGDMETMEETADKEMEPAKAGHQPAKGV